MENEKLTEIYNEILEKIETNDGKYNGWTKTPENLVSGIGGMSPDPHNFLIRQGIVFNNNTMWECFDNYHNFSIMTGNQINTCEWDRVKNYIPKELKAKLDEE